MSKVEEGPLACCPCCWCFPGDELGDQDRYTYGDQQFQVSMLNSCCKAPCAFCFAFTCPCCANIKLRYDVLGGDMEKYMCCQGMFGGCCCIQPGNMCDKDCPWLCLCLEAWCCLSFAISASRWYIMEQRNLHSDPCDRRIIQCNNCLQCLSCLCTILACFCEEARDAAECVQHIAHCFFLCTQACMCAQVYHEVQVYPVTQTEAVPPPQQTMT